MFSAGQGLTRRERRGSRRVQGVMVSSKSKSKKRRAGSSALSDPNDLQDIRENVLSWFHGFGRFRDEQTGQPTPGRANILQRRMFAHYQWCREHNKPCRMVVLKHRRAGSSTASAALLYTHAQNYLARLGVIGTDYKASSNMLAMLKHFGRHDVFPCWDTPEDASASEGLSLPADSQQGRQSQYPSAGSRGSEGGTAEDDTANFLHQAEACLWSHMPTGTLEGAAPSAPERGISRSSDGALRSSPSAADSVQSQNACRDGGPRDVWQQEYERAVLSRDQSQNPTVTLEGAAEEEASTRGGRWTGEPNLRILNPFPLTSAVEAASCRFVLHFRAF